MCLYPEGLFSAVGERWKGLSAEEKVEYEKRAAKNKTAYETSMVEYETGKQAGTNADSADAGKKAATGLSEPQSWDPG